jgi:hypothetical protein
MKGTGFDAMLARAAAGLEPVTIDGFDFVRVAPRVFNALGTRPPVDVYRITFRSEAEAEALLSRVGPPSPPPSTVLGVLFGMLADLADVGPLPELELELDAQELEAEAAARRRSLPAGAGAGWRSCAAAAEREPGSSSRCTCGDGPGHLATHHRDGGAGACTILGCSCGRFEARA